MESNRSDMNQQLKQACDDTSKKFSRTCRILVVEDNKAIAETIQLVLRHEGYETKWCSDESVYDLIGDWKPDLILMDLRLPGLDGSLATRHIKSNPATSTIPIIVITAEPVTPDTLAVLPANDLVRKPFRIAQLLDRIRYWISAHTGRQGGFASMEGGLNPIS
jgi:DNA-binding response OmpR family regulator